MKRPIARNRAGRARRPRNRYPRIRRRRRVDRLRVRLAVGLLVVLAAAVGFAVISAGASDTQRVRTTSDLSENEVVSIVNSARVQWAADQELLRLQRPSVSRMAARAAAEARLEKVEAEYWDALQGIRPGLDEEMLEIVERLPVPPAPELVGESIYRP